MLATYTTQKINVRFKTDIGSWTKYSIQKALLTVYALCNSMRTKWINNNQWRSKSTTQNQNQNQNHNKYQTKKFKLHVVPTCIF